MKLNEFMDALIAEPVTVYERSIGELIKLGESAILEFKSSFQWDVVQNAINKELRYSSLKTIAAFLNSSGGTLVIGVEDNGGVLGLHRDLQHVKNQSLDGFEQLVANVFYETIGAQFAPFIKFRYEQIEGQQVCVVDVDKDSTARFHKDTKRHGVFCQDGHHYPISQPRRNDGICPDELGITEVMCYFESRQSAHRFGFSFQRKVTGLLHKNT